MTLLNTKSFPAGLHIINRFVFTKLTRYLHIVALKLGVRGCPQRLDFWSDTTVTGCILRLTDFRVALTMSLYKFAND